MLLRLVGLFDNLQVGDKNAHTVLLLSTGGVVLLELRLPGLKESGILSGYLGRSRGKAEVQS